jgi:hypothetical protein
LSIDLAASLRRIKPEKHRAQLTPRPRQSLAAASRCQGFAPQQRKNCLNDALIYLTAAKAGVPVRTANRDEFDLIQQIAGAGDFVFY